MNGGTVIDTIIKDRTIEIITVADRGKGKFSVFLNLSDACKCVEAEDSVFFDKEKTLWSPKSRCFRDYNLGKPIKFFEHKEVKSEYLVTKD